MVCNGETALDCPRSPVSNGSCSTHQPSDIVDFAPDNCQESDEPSSRYPLFIQVKNGAQDQSKARIVKPVGRPSNQGPSKQENAQGKQPVRPRRSASFSTPRKTSESRALGGAPSRPSQDTVRNGNLRREKSDIVAKPRRAQSPANVSSIPRPARSNSSASLKQDKGLSSPRSKSPAGLQRETSDLTRRRSPSGLRREKSDIVRPRGQSRTDSPVVTSENTVGNISRSSSNKSLPSNQLIKSPSKSSIEETRCRSGSSSEMSKIPSRIPSLAKQNGAEERTPPKSKIPSLSKADKGQETVKKSQIPSVGRKDSTSQKEKPASKIPSSAPQQSRPDSAKENKDPTVPENGHESVKQFSKIPSFGKGANVKPKIPSVPRKDSQTSVPSTQNGTTDMHSPVSDSNRSKASSPAHTQQGTGIPMGISRIPSFTKSPTPLKKDDSTSSQSRIPPPSTKPLNKVTESKLPTLGGSKVLETDGPSVTQSHIPSPSSPTPNKTFESKVPPPGGSKIPEPKLSTKSTPSSLPTAPKTSGIPKPGEQLQGTKIPAHTGIPMASSPTESKNKIPKLATTPRSNVPDANEAAASKPKRSIPTLGGRQPSMERESSSPAEPSTPPSTPIRKDATESPLDKYIFSEAKRVEQLLRDEPMEVTSGADIEEDDEFLRQEREILEQEELAREKGLKMLDSKEAEDLISEVLKSYAPDKLEDKQITTEKGHNENVKEKINIDEIVLQPTEMQTPPKLGKTGVSTTKEDSVQVEQSGVKESVSTTEEKKENAKTVETNVSDLKISIPSKTAVESEIEEKTDKKETKNQGPGNNTLGEYAQQARLSRSRQRKIVSPNSEEPEKEFLADLEKVEIEEEKKPLPKEPEKEQPKKDIKKDKYGTAPFEGEKKPKEAAKNAKSKSKSDKPKFVIESSLGKDFYATRKSSESVASRDSVHDDVVKSSFKPEISALVFENKVAREPLTLKQTDASPEEHAMSLEEAEFEDVDLNAEPAIAKQRRELSRSVDDLDEKTVKCMCGRGGKCSIM